MRLFGALRPGLADALTIGNALCGAAAIVLVVAAPPATDAAGELAVLRIVTLLLLTGVVFDVCDGAVARARGGTPLGQHLDSLADAVAFGVAPATAVAGLAMRHASTWEVVALGIAALAYVAAVLVRLADFDARRTGDLFFTGMPSPIGAISALSIGLLTLPPWLTAIGVLLVGWLMVSAVRYPHSRGKGLVAEAIGLAIAVAGIVGLFDVRLPAAIVLAFTVLIVPTAYAVGARRRGAPRPTRVTADPPAEATGLSVEQVDD